MMPTSADSQSLSSMSKEKATGYSIGKDDDIIQTSKTITDEFISESVSEHDSVYSVEKEEDNTLAGKFRRIIDLLSVDGPSGEKGIVETYLYNEDLRPVEKERRVWTWKQYISFWISGSFNVNTWQISATGLQLGLNWWQTWICIWVGYFFVAIFLVAGSRVGNMYHISFPIASRISYGPYFAIWVVLNRVVMACVWFSTLAYLGGECVQLMLRTIFGNNLAERLGDHISDPNLNNYQFMCFMLFWIVGLPFLWFPPHKLRHVFAVKAFMAPIAAFAFLIWTLVKADGKLAFGNLNGGGALSSSATAWAVIRSIMSALDNFSTLILNAADFSRFAKSPKSSTYSQFIALPLCYAIISLIGILTTTAAYNMYGVNYWSPLDVLDRYLDDFNSGNRAGVFFISFAFAFDQLASNLAGNAIPAGTDMTALLPKFINIRRGSFICAGLALCICPWDLMASSSKFTTALSAYAVFLSAIAGVQFADYFVVRKGYVNIYHCYTNKLDSYYMYNKYGTNWRAVVAYIAGIVPNFTGFIGSLEVSVPEGAMKIYYLNYFVGYLIAALVYLVLVYFYPIKGVPNNAKLTDKVWYESWIEVENFTETRQSFERFGDENVKVRQTV